MVYVLLEVAEWEPHLEASGAVCRPSLSTCCSRCRHSVSRDPLLISGDGVRVFAD